MMKKTMMTVCILGLSLALGLTGCNQSEVKSLQDELAKTRKEKDAIEAKMYVVTQARDELLQQVTELTKSRDKTQKQLSELETLRGQAAELETLRGQINELTQSGAALQKQNQELKQLRDAAAAEAQAAQLRIDDLAKKLEAETQKVRVLQEQLKQVQAAIAELQKSIKL